MMRAIERGLCLADFEVMTIGMIMGYITACNNEHLGEDEKEDSVRIAGQADYDAF